MTSPGTHPAVRWKTLLRRGWPALLLGPLLGLALGAYLHSVHKNSYAASVTVLVSPTGVASTTQVQGGRTTGLVNLDTEANLVKSTPVLLRARSLLKISDSVTTVADRITIVVPPNSQLLVISYTTSTPAQAQKGATAVAQAYLADRAATANATIKAQKKLVQTNVDSATKALSQAVTDLTNSPSGSTKATLAASQKDLLTRRIADLNSQAVTLDNTVITPGQITAPAQTPTTPAGSGTALYLGSGLAAGILLGLLGAYLLARRKIGRLRDAGDVDESIGLPVIARIDKLQMGVLAEDRTPAAESYRRLANVVNASLGSHGGVIVVAGCDDSSVASTVTHNIAATLSRSGEKVSVLRAGQTTANGSSSAPESGAVDETAQDGTDPHREPENPYRLIAGTGPRTRKLIGEMRKDEDGFILIDVPEPLSTADAQSYAANADAVLVVMRHRTRTSQARLVLAEFDAVSAPILGAVMVKVVDGRSGNGSGEQFAPVGAGDDSRAITPDGVTVHDLQLEDYDTDENESTATNGATAAGSPAERRVNRMRSRLPRG